MNNTGMGRRVFSMHFTPVLIAGGGPVGMTLAHDLARRGVDCTLIERKASTTVHPKMDITNGRSMELFRRAGLAPALRAAAVPESHPFDVSWITSLVGHELHRFRYPSVDHARIEIRERNDGSQPREPAMRVSQVEIEPVLKRAIDAQPLVDVRFGVEFVALEQDRDGVTVVVRRQDDDTLETLRCHYLIGCDGGTSNVRNSLGIPLSGVSRIMPRFMTHFRSAATNVLQRFGIAWHYQSINGTLIAQNDKDVWTLQSRFPPGQAPADVDPDALLRKFAGTAFDHQILVANHWSPHLLVADSYRKGRVLLAGDAVHQYIPTGGYGMNTGIGDAYDLGWKLAAIIRGFGGPGLIESYEQERRPVGLRNREASQRHNDVRVQIAQVYQDDMTTEAARAAASARIAELGNSENECRGVEFGYAYPGSPIVSGEANCRPPDDFVLYQPTTIPGVRLPSVFLGDGEALYDRLGAWFTLLVFGACDPSAFVAAANDSGVPLDLVRIDEPALLSIYEAGMILVRPDHHIAWRGNAIADERAAMTVLCRATGWIGAGSEVGKPLKG
jgi:2-polyprenyl-6-methoxyphenol hydroxylase-like FAD-dependent oxidoreductase